MEPTTGRDNIKIDITKEDDEMISQIAQKTGVSKDKVMHKLLNMAMTPKEAPDQTTERLDKLQQIMKTTQTTQEGSDDFLNKMLNIESIRAVKGDNNAGSDDSAAMKDIMKMGFQMKMMQTMMPQEPPQKNNMIDNLIMLKMIEGDGKGNNTDMMDKLMAIEQKRQEMTAQDSDKKFDELKSMFFEKKTEDNKKESDAKLNALEDKFVNGMGQLQATVANMTPQEKQGLGAELTQMTDTMNALTGFMQKQGYSKEAPIVSKEGAVSPTQLLSKGIGALEKIGTAFANKPPTPPQGAAPVQEMEVPPEQYAQPPLTPNEQQMYEQQMQAEQQQANIDAQQAQMPAEAQNPEIQAQMDADAQAQADAEMGAPVEEPVSSDDIGLPGQNPKTEE